MIKQLLTVVLIVLMAATSFAAIGKKDSVNFNDAAFVQSLHEQLSRLNLPTLDTAEKVTAQINNMAALQNQNNPTVAVMEEPDRPILPPEEEPLAVLGAIKGKVVRQSDGTTAVSGLRMTLYRLIAGIRVLVNTTTTDGSGNYQFSNLVGGSYYVQATGLIGASLDYIGKYWDNQGSLGSATLISISGNTVNNVDFNLVKYGKISGKVTLQSNGSGAVAASVTLFNTSWSTVGTTVVVAGDGSYSIGDLFKIAPGNYYAVAFRVDLAHEYWNEAPFDFEADVITVTDGQQVSNINFTLQAMASIGMYVWNDLNENGNYELGEPGLSGVTVRLKYNGHEIHVTKPTVLGFYVFTGLPIVPYSVELDPSTLPYGYTFSHGSNPWAVTPAAGELKMDVNFGLKPCWGQAGGWIYNDKNLNGKKDADETGIGKATVILKGAVDGHDSQTDTGANGFFRFKKVYWDNYTMYVSKKSLPANYVQTTGTETVSFTMSPCGNYFKDFFFADPDTITSEPCDSLVFVEGTPTLDGQSWDNAVDQDTTDWDGTACSRGEEPLPEGPAWAIFSYTCTKLSLFNQIMIKTDNGLRDEQQLLRQAKAVELSVSCTTTDADSFAVVDTLQIKTGNWQAFNYSNKIQARYIKLALLTPTDTDSSWRQLVEFSTHLVDYPVLQLSNQAGIAVAAPTSFELGQNYPNPFNPQTSIVYNLTKEVKVDLRVFDMNGRQVAELVNGQQGAGQHSVVWNAQGLPSGTYIYQLKVDGMQQTKRMVFLK
jgi:hypothetical protein